MVWSDPEDGDTGRTPNEARAAGIVFGCDVTREFCASIGVRETSSGWLGGVAWALGDNLFTFSSRLPG